MSVVFFPFFPLSLKMELEGGRREEREVGRVFVQGICNADCGDRYLSQVRQELAIRLLSRLYADGPTPSKVRSGIFWLRTKTNCCSGGSALRRGNSWGSHYRK